ncbi:MAG: YciI family protein [Gemmatimonadales bacterium]
MKYLCLIYENEKACETIPEAQANQIMGEYFAFTDSVQKSGHYVAGEALQPTHTATTVRVRNGKVSTTDGPFAETKEQLGGYYLIEARDLNDAIQVASRIPGARMGSVEVRPIVVFDRPQQ